MLTSRKSQLLSGWVLIASIGCFVGWWNYQSARAERFADLLADARRCALAFRHEDLRTLKGTREDESAPAYAAVKTRLMHLRSVHPGVRFVYIFRHLPEKKQVIYLADSESNGSADLSRPGDPFPEADAMPGLQSILRDGRPATEGPLSDSFGEWVTGYAAIADEITGSSKHPPREVLGLDIAAHDWQGGLWELSVRRALYVWLLLGLPLGAFALSRRYSSQASFIQKLSSAVEQSESAILIVDRHGRIEYANAGLCRQLGYPPDELVGRHWRDFSNKEGPVKSLAAAIATGGTWIGEWILHRKNGDIHPTRGAVSPVRGPDGKLAGSIAVIVDASSARRQEDTLRREKESAETADRAKGVFLATMSHEVRTPLNGIVGFANLLLDTALTVEQREYVQTIRTSGEALVHLTGDILDFSRIESGGFQLDASPCDLRGATEDVLDIFAAKAAERDLQLLHSIDPDVPTQVLVDVGRLRQVLVNLVGNAIKFTPAGEVEVSLRLLTGKGMSMAPFDREALSAHGQMVAEFDDGSLMVEFAVRDTGIGIAVDDRPKLFQAFTQLEAPEVKRFGGAGLGLVISRNLIRLMGGDIWLESEPGRGSTFFFTARCGRSKEQVDAPAANLLAGRRVAVVARAEGLRDELLHVLRINGAEAVATSLEALSEMEDALAVVDCEPALLLGWEDRVAPTRWRSARAFGLVNVKLTPPERQRLRPHFRMLLNKPLHHRTLIDLLAKAAKAASAAATAPAPTVAPAIVSPPATTPAAPETKQTPA